MINEKSVEAEELNPDSKHRFIFQFVCGSTGIRSEPFESNWTELQEILDLRTDDNPKPDDEDYILLVAVLDGKQTHIPSSPLLKVATYESMVSPEKVKEAS